MASPGHRRCSAVPQRHIQSQVLVSPPVVMGGVTGESQGAKVSWKSSEVFFVALAVSEQVSEDNSHRQRAVSEQVSREADATIPDVVSCAVPATLIACPARFRRVLRARSYHDRNVIDHIRSRCHFDLLLRACVWTQGRSESLRAHIAHTGNRCFCHAHTLSINKSTASARLVAASR